MPELYVNQRRSPYGTIGAAIKHFREKNKLTQAQLAKKVGVGQACLSHYEHDRTTPSVKVLQKLSRELGVAMNLLAEHRYTFL
jgi:transcriptional regulator with XRE-family HTH domain